MNEELIQGSEDWKRARVGKVTASRISDVIARTKTGWGASRKNYAAELIAERLTGEPAPSFTNGAMQWGLDTEPQARAAYEFFRDAEVVEIGLIDHPTIPMSAASPDGLVSDDGVLELKCPLTATHIETLLTKAVPDKYLVQMLWQMACTGRQWVDFVSFDPRMPESLRMFVKRVQRDNARIAELETEVKTFLKEIDATVAALTGLSEPNTILGAGE